MWRYLSQLVIMLFQNLFGNTVQKNGYSLYFLHGSTVLFTYGIHLLLWIIWCQIQYSLGYKRFSLCDRGRELERDQEKNDERVNAQSLPEEIEKWNVFSCSIKKDHLVKRYIGSSSAYSSIRDLIKLNKLFLNALCMRSDFSRNFEIRLQ